MLSHRFSTSWLLLGLLLLASACARRPLPVEPLTSRPAAYRAVPVAAASIPVQVYPVVPAVAVTQAVATSSTEQTHVRYEQAYEELAKMLDGRYPLSFKRAVFVTENAYLDDQLRYEDFVGALHELVEVCRIVEQTIGPHLRYDGPDRASVLRNAVLFRVLTDSTRFVSGRVLAPYGYDFEDFNGDRDWRQMFVSKLLATHRGNCHSLPFLYQLLAQETGAPSWLALAPNHIYLKQHDQRNGWYNTELTSRTFPNDAWLTASGYISKETIVSGIYLDTLTARHNVVLCLVDLAKGYQRRVGAAASEEFSLRCTALALQYFPQYINAQLLQAETLRHRFERQTTSAEAQQAFANMEAVYTRIVSTGYREMPAQMYADWLQLVRQEKARYQTHR